MQVSDGGDFNPNSLQGQWVNSIMLGLTPEDCEHGLWQHMHGPLWMYPPLEAPARDQWVELLHATAEEALEDNEDSIHRATKACENAMTVDPRSLQCNGVWTEDQQQWLQYEGYIDEMGNVIRGIPLHRELYDKNKAENDDSLLDEDGQPHGNPVTKRKLLELKALEPGLEKMYLPNGTYCIESV